MAQSGAVQAEGSDAYEVTCPVSPVTSQEMLALITVSADTTGFSF